MTNKPSDFVLAEAFSCAFQEAEKALIEGEFPVGSCLLFEGRVIAKGHNLCNTNYDPSAHAEVLVIREAAYQLGKVILQDCTLISTLEPCLMCTGTILRARIDEVIYMSPNLELPFLDSVRHLPPYCNRTRWRLCESAEYPCARLVDIFNQRKEEISTHLSL